MSEKLTYEQSGEGGLNVRLEVRQHSLVAKALRGEKVVAVVSQGHGGVFGPDTFAPQSSVLAKCLMNEVLNKALNRALRKSQFDMLAEELRIARDTKRVFGSYKPAILIKRPRRKPAKKPAALFFTSR